MSPRYAQASLPICFDSMTILEFNVTLFLTVIILFRQKQIFFYYKSCTNVQYTVPFKLTYCALTHLGRNIRADSKGAFEKSYHKEKKH